ncbi:hypothetical protein GQS65_00360 [Halomarina oriensis]|uniref:Halobacterial output domain-containing protein n=1 Tax=Halomarina oriensis TaxID=671145 RepID=A0A6B0GN13_9EURY|nr:hypothetical protein [Halomarina oriensis]
MCSQRTTESSGRVHAGASVRIVEAVARRESCDPLDLPPLYDVIDPDALNQFCATATGSITFQWAGCRVRVDVDDRLLVSVE